MLEGLKRVYLQDPSREGPQKIYIEITGGCNLRCPNCPRTYSSNTRGNIQDDLYGDIIEAIRIEYPRLPELAFHFFGEIEVKKNFDVLVKQAREALPDTHLAISTTLTLKNPDVVTRLLGCGFDSIGVWPDGYSKESYAQIRPGGDYDVVKDNIRHLMQEREQLGLEHIAIHVGMVRNAVNTKHIPAFVDEFRFAVEYPNTEFCFVDAHDWAGQTPAENIVKSVSHYRLKVPTPCSMPFTTMIISADGEGSLCCYDMDMGLSVGYLQPDNISVKALWESDKAQEIRKSMQRLAPPELCRNCHNFWRDLTPSNRIANRRRRRQERHIMRSLRL